MPLLTAFFDVGVTAQKLPPLEEVRRSLQLRESGFRLASNLQLGRCYVLQGTLAAGTSPAELLDRSQESLDSSFGTGALTAMIQRERCEVTPALNFVPVKGVFQPGAVQAAEDEEPLLLLVFMTDDLPIPPEEEELTDRLLAASSLLACAGLANTLAFAVNYAHEFGPSALPAEQLGSGYVSVTKYISMIRRTRVDQPTVCLSG
ncbi:unnamed protein product, partial [Prorocentrum cordatum]